MKTEQLLEFKFIDDLIYYDGPIISLGLIQDDSPVLQIWCDVNHEENYNLYAYAFLRKEDFQLFVDAEKSYFNVLKDSQEIVVFKYNGKAYDFSVMPHAEFLSNYGPQEDSSMADDLIDFRKSLEAFYIKDSV